MSERLTSRVADSERAVDFPPVRTRDATVEIRMTGNETPEVS